jgi:hypothetical protein
MERALLSGPLRVVLPVMAATGTAAGGWALVSSPGTSTDVPEILVFTLISLCALYAGAAAAVNRRTLRVTRGRLARTLGPLPLGRDWSIDCASVAELSHEQDEADPDQITWCVVAREAGTGTRHIVIGLLEDEREATRAMESLRVALGHLPAQPRSSPPHAGAVRT